MYTNNTLAECNRNCLTMFHEPEYQFEADLKSSFITAFVAGLLIANGLKKGEYILKKAITNGCLSQRRIIFYNKEKISATEYLHQISQSFFEVSFGVLLLVYIFHNTSFFWNERLNSKCEKFCHKVTHQN